MDGNLFDLQHHVEAEPSITSQSKTMNHTWQMELWSTIASRTLWPETDKPVRTSASSGPNSHGLFAKLGRDGSWLRTCWDFLAQRTVSSSVVYCETWPKFGMMRNGLCYRLPSSGHHTGENESSFWRTPQVADWKSSKIQAGQTTNLTHQVFALWPTPTAIDSGSGRINKSLGKNAKERPTLALMARKGLWPTPAAQDGKNASLPSSQATRDTLPGELLREQEKGYLNPEWVEALMGFPPGWTDIDGPPCLENDSTTGNHHE